VTEDISAIADLRCRWHTLCDADRALEVQSMHQADMSLLKLAVHLNCSRSLLSRSRSAAKASPEDLDRARRGKISTRELARRGDAADSRGTIGHREAIAFKIERAAVQESRTIESWLSDAASRAPTGNKSSNRRTRICSKLIGQLEISRKASLLACFSMRPNARTCSDEPSRKDRFPYRGLRPVLHFGALARFPIAGYGSGR